MKNLRLVLAIFMLPLASVIGQEVNFETETSVTPNFGATAIWIDNPDKTGVNTSNKCLQIGRTSTVWWELVDVPIGFTVPANTTKYIHIMVLYAEQPDFGIRYNTDGATHRRSNDYTDVSKWQDLVVPLTAGGSDLEVTQIRIGADIGDSRYSSGQILNNTDKFGLVDEIIVNDDDTPRSLTTDIIKKADEKKYILYAGNGKICFKSQSEEVVPINIYNASGVLVKTYAQNHFEYQTPLSGLYIVQVGNITEKIIIK
ncbi:T9SS type A sorting domain-containing protein [Saccharicrinis sp. GN24d3]|uniref:T9SS type A sorting domain-containing protein n=1 Tax=Saccharicrinis sp. GN24d3 TaxID=3458416 RepID=UPI00403654A0